MPDYSKGKIYKIVSEFTDEIYIGSSSLTLAKRMDLHRSDFKKYLKSGKGCSSVILMKYADAHMVMIENFPCKSKDELEKQEGKYQREMICVNQRIAGRTKKEWCKDNKVKISQWHKKNYESNKEKISQQKKKYRDEHKLEISQWHKKYYESNKEKISQYQKKYQEENKMKIAIRRKSKKITCECGSVVICSAIARHRLSMKHQAFMSSQ